MADVRVRIFGSNETKPAFDDAINDAHRAGQGIAAAGGRASAGVNSLSGQTGNLAAQFQDIAVQLQSGQSPFTIALQQGTQVSAVLGPLGAGGAAKALGAAFMSLLSPVSLITIGAIAAGGALIQMFTSAKNTAPGSEAALKAHDELLHKILAGYKGITKEVDAYTEGLKQLPLGEAAGEAADNLERQAEAYRAAVADLSAAGADLVERVSIDANTKNLLSPDQAQLLVDIGLAAQAAEPDVNAVIGALKDIGRDQQVPAAFGQIAFGMLGAAESARKLAGEVGKADIAVQGLTEATQTFRGLGIGDALKDLQGLTPDLKSPKQKIADIFALAAPNARTMSELDALVVAAERATEAIAGEEAIAAGKLAEEESKRQAAAYRTVIDALGFEQELVGLNAREQEKLNQIRAAGVEVTSAEADAIRDKVDALYDAREQEETLAKLRADAMPLTDVKSDPITTLVTKLGTLRDAYDATAISADEFARGVQKSVAESVSGVAGLAGDALDAFGQMFEGNKAIAAASAIVNGIGSVAKTFETYGATPWGFAAAGVAAATAAANVASILSTSKTSKSMPGTSVGGGASIAAAGPAQQSAINLTVRGSGLVSTDDLVSQITQQIADGGHQSLVNVIKAA